MYRRWLLATLLLTLPSSLPAQDAHSLGIGFAATAATMDFFGIYWNPALLGLPSAGIWTIATGGSFFDTSNTGSPILRFTSDNAMQSGQDPVNRYQQYLGTFGVKYTSLAGGVVYDQELNYSSSQSALSFFHDRDNNAVASGSAYTNLSYLQTNQQIYNLTLSYASPFPLGALPFFAIGGSLKYHDGVQYQQTSLMGAYHQSTPSDGAYQYTKTTSTSGLGLSIDTGFMAKFTEAIQVAMMFQNIQSNFNWQAQQQTFALDGSGKESLSGTTNVTVPANFPYATKLGLVGSPPDKNIALEGEVAWTQGQVNWRFGLERWYPESHLVVRLGTFADRVSNSQLWTFGGGYQVADFNIDLSFLTRSLPAVQDSIAFGAAFDMEKRF